MVSKTLFQECLRQGFESFLDHIGIHSFPVSQLHRGILDVVWFSRDEHYWTAEITVFTLQNLEVKFFFLWAKKEDLQGHAWLLGDKAFDDTTSQNVQQSLQDIGYSSSQSGGNYNGHPDNRMYLFETYKPPREDII